MRILSWNINGIRTLPQYHPWNTLKTGEAILSELKADIICFQEMKIHRTALQKHIAVPDRFDSFFSLPVTKGGYSGVAIYTNSDVAAPVKAEEGLIGQFQPKPAFTPEERISPSYPQAHQIEFFPDENEGTPSSLTALDDEGRALVLDFGLFVLINVYCPAETSDTRLPYKMNFHLLLEERVRKLICEEGREVIVVGDINICAAPIDHCDGQLPSQLADFWGHPPRAWFKKWLVPSGPMVDVIRDVWPERKGLYTCWNTKISAREGNYGTRIDYILLTRGLLSWFKHGDIQPSIRGSDHCPVYVDLYDEIQLNSGEKINLRDAMRFEEGKRKPPRISARVWDEFSGKQRLLSNFFAKKASGDALSPSSLSPSRSQGSILVDQVSQLPATDTPPSQLVQLKKSSGTETPSASQHVPSATETSSPSTLKRSSSMSKKCKRTEDIPAGEPKKKKLKVGQMKLSSFFTKPPGTSSSSSASASRSSSMPMILDLDKDELVGKSPASEHTQMDADYQFALSLSQPSDTTTISTSPSSQSKAAWTQLLAPLQPPKCKVHGEPCKEFTVNKAGPNKGKAFFICSRPVGPGYDKGKSQRLREEVDWQYRCDFFKWASEVKRAALEDSAKGVPSGPTSTGSKVVEIGSSHILP